jgi:hypothetical protein
MKVKTDHVAIGVAVACGIHCFCIPILLGISAVAGVISGVSEPLEHLFLGSSFLLGISSLLFSWRKHHHRPECLALFVAGIAMVALRHNISSNGIAGVAGGILVGTAHWRNLQLCRRSTCCSEGPCDITHSGEAASAPNSE